MNNIFDNLSSTSDEENDNSMLEAVYSAAQRPPYSTILKLSRELKKDNSIYQVRQWFRKRRRIDQEKSLAEGNTDISTTSRRNNDRIPPIILHIHCSSNANNADIIANHRI